ncbi:DNA-directed RNA polymerase subunit L [Striga asiatica]|uniref:DNA-directed RNA polymerases I and III subunit RPAC2 n=1 Tax=Striga asiatica TaxID=4170 RepID=A0A5A7QMY0_STRAF|nr:DNA-directed RNA polymerase subunit L [Striga asiatica]
MSIEHGLLGDQSQATFSFTDEDHTLANSLRYILNQDPRVTFCGYSIPHPSDARVNVRVQTTGDPAREVLKDSCQDLMLVCQHVRNAADEAVTVFKSKQGVESMDIK